MKRVAVSTRSTVLANVLKQADRQPVVLTVRGQPRYLIRSLKPSNGPRPRKRSSSEDRDWTEIASSRLLSAYAEADAVYEELLVR